MTARARIGRTSCLLVLLFACAACGGGSGAGHSSVAPADDPLEKLLAQGGMTVCADFTPPRTSGCTEYTAENAECAAATNALDDLAYRRCEIQWDSSADSQVDPVCAALAPSDPQGYAVKPLDACD
jgi:hypothetical protein